MPITVEALASKSIPLTVEWAGEKVNLHYRPYCEATEDTRKAADEGLSAEEQESALRLNLADLVIDWDITESGKMFPVDAHEMKRLPHPLLVKIRSEIWTDMYPNLRGGA